MAEPINAPFIRYEQHVNEEFTESYRGPSEILQEPLVDIRQAAYELTELEYTKIVKGDNAAAKYTWEFFIISAGYLVIIVAKYLGKAEIENWEFIAAIIAIVLFLILHKLAGRFLPSDKKKVLNKIQEFFKDHQPSYELHRKKR